MSKPFDTAMKELVLANSADWLRMLGFRPDVELREADTDLTGFAPQADKVFRVLDLPPWLLHLEFQAGRDGDFSDRMLAYHVLLWWRHRTPVESVAILLRPQAEGVRLEGRVLREPLAGGTSRTEFQFRVIRVWELPAELLLEGGPGTLPLAPIADLGKNTPEAIAREVERRILRDVEPEQRASVWASAWLLAGLRFRPERVAELYKGVGAMRESSTYQAILEEGVGKGLDMGLRQGLEQGLSKGREEGRSEGVGVGRAEEARRMLLLVGEGFLGRPAPSVRRVVARMDDPANLEALARRLPSVKDWNELLNPPAPRRSRKR